jgi:hypothetical protein
MLSEYFGYAVCVYLYERERETGVRESEGERGREEGEREGGREGEKTVVEREEARERERERAWTV